MICAFIPLFYFKFINTSSSRVLVAISSFNYIILFSYSYNFILVFNSL